MINVYYGPIENHKIMLLWNKIIPLNKSIADFHSSLNDDVLRTCPAFMASLKNTYAIPCPCDTTLVREESGDPISIMRSLLDKDGVVRKDGGEAYEHLAQSLSNFYVFFADGPVELEQTPPYLHHGKIFGVSGRFDISRWFRSLNLATMFGESAVIKKYEPFAYVKFHANDKIKLHTVRWPLEADLMQQQNILLKNATTVGSLNNHYSLFDKSQNAKKILKMAKENIWEV
jgi:hypothetical protein